MSYDFSVAVTVSLDINSRTQVFLYEMMAQLMRLKGVQGMPPAGGLPQEVLAQMAAGEATQVETGKAEAEAENVKAQEQSAPQAEAKAEAKAEAVPAQEQSAGKEAAGKPLPAPVEQSAAEEEPVTQEALVALRQKVVAFCQAGGDKSKAVFAAWLKEQKLGRLTDIKTAAQAAALEEVLSA